MLSDLHYGSNLDKRLVRFPFGPTEETRRTAAVMAQVADYKRQYRAETEVTVHILGDIIQGKIHDRESTPALSEQYDRALHCLIHGIEFLATEFKQVNVRVAVGNHDRDEARHGDRARQAKWDSHGWRIYRALWYRFQKTANISMQTGIRGYYTYTQFGMKGVMTHGDTIFDPGNPGKEVAIGRLKAQTDAFRLSHPEELDACLFGVGHVHIASDVDVGERSTIVTNGCLIPSDEYAASIGFFNTPCRQQLWETVDGHMFGDHRKIKVSTTDDADKTLDRIIPPWTPLE